MSRVIAIDFAGTLVPQEIIDEANSYRADIMKRGLPTTEDHANSEKLYGDNRAFVEAMTGLTGEHKVRYTAVDGTQHQLRGVEVQNQIATTLFQIGMYQAAKAHGKNTFLTGWEDTLTELKARGYTLAIHSGVRTDIISGMLEIAGFRAVFDIIVGQPSTLGVSNEEQLDRIKEHGEVIAVIGDKRTDLEPAVTLGAESIFVTWGTPQGGEEELADHVIDSPKEILDILK